MGKSLVILGPTTVGKTDVALAVAKRNNGELICGDSLQVFKYFRIGSGQMYPDEAGDIPTHLYSSVEPLEKLEPSVYAMKVSDIEIDTLKRGALPIVEGCSKRYIGYLVKNRNMTENSRLFVGLRPHTSANVRGRMEKRLEKMIKDGLLDEVRNGLSAGYRNSEVLAEGIAYNPIVRFIDGEISLAQAKQLIVENALNCAKRQIEFFGQFGCIEWIDYNPSEKETVVRLMEDMLVG